MRIAFYAPLKSPDHPVPSGDRLMAGLLMRALAMAGHDPVLVSHLRPYLRQPDAGMLAPFQAEAHSERDRISHDWRRTGVPDLWISYHPYYKSPDLLGPALAQAFGLPYVTVESSWSARRTAGDWGVAQGLVRQGLEQAALNLCVTDRDQRGILETLPTARTARLPPFIDTAPFVICPPMPRPPMPHPGQLITVAMMRPGDKLSSYLALAHALRGLPRDDWHLTIVGDGPARAEVEAAFAPIAGRVTFTGALPQPGVARALSQASIYIWPGHDEAYGLAYLEAQAAGLPVIAEATAGVPEVVISGQTGRLTPPGDTDALRRAITTLLDHPRERDALAARARAFARDDRSLTGAAARLATLLTPLEPNR